MRIERIASLIEKEVSVIIGRELKDPRLGIVTITRVVVKPDLKSALVYFSTLGDRECDTLTLRHARGFIRSLLARRVNLRFIPELDFKFDDSLEYAQKIEKLFDQLKKNGCGE